MKKEEYVIVCHEINKYSSDLTAESCIYVSKRGVTPEDYNEIFYLHLRSKYNVELKYYLCKVLSTMTDEEIVKLAEMKSLKEPTFIKI